jgi:hypothetical protein
MYATRFSSFLEGGTVNQGMILILTVEMEKPDRLHAIGGKTRGLFKRPSWTL